MTSANSSARPGTQPTSRELEVLQAWAAEHSAAAAGKALGLSQSGVEAMLANCRARANVKHTWQAALKFLPEVVKGDSVAP